MNSPNEQVQYVKNVNKLNDKVKSLTTKKVYQRPNLIE